MNIYPDSRMSVPEFTKLSTFIYSNCGIKLPITKKTMLEGRLHKRLRALGIATFKDYCQFLFSAEGTRLELFHMIDVVTTNKTDFFREAAHFEYLVNHVLPSASKDSVFNVWSAGCSTGEEPYTLAMVLNDFAEKNLGFNYNIFATDISGRVLQTAATAVYAEEKVAPVPLAMKRKYLLKSKNATQKTVRIVPELRNKVVFDRLNFIDGDFSTINTFNVIFCRNVLIYFDRATQEKVIYKLCKKLEPGGILCLGHSESIASMNLPLAQIQPTTFRKI
jgi:chemotaxis protein methyltransferase CheR